VVLQLAIQGRAVDAQQRRGPGLVAARGRQRRDDRLALELDERPDRPRIGRRASAPRAAAPAAGRRARAPARRRAPAPARSRCAARGRCPASDSGTAPRAPPGRPARSAARRARRGSAGSADTAAGCRPGARAAAGSWVWITLSRYSRSSRKRPSRPAASGRGGSPRPGARRPSISREPPTRVRVRFSSTRSMRACAAGAELADLVHEQRARVRPDEHSVVLATAPVKAPFSWPNSSLSSSDSAIAAQLIATNGRPPAATARGSAPPPAPCRSRSRRAAAPSTPSPRPARGTPAGAGSRRAPDHLPVARPPTCTAALSCWRSRALSPIARSAAPRTPAAAAPRRRAGRAAASRGPHSA
jgi:hypothetical protein